jgi:hypothetical protein
MMARPQRKAERRAGAANADRVVHAVKQRPAPVGKRATPSEQCSGEDGWN